MLSMITPIVLLPQVDAAVTTYNSYVYVSASTKVIGVGQSVLFVAWTADVPPDIGETVGTVTSPTGRAGWTGMQINLTKPNGESAVLDMPYSDPVGANYISYTPDATGTYYIQAKFPETWKKTALPFSKTPYHYGLRHLCQTVIGLVQLTVQTETGRFSQVTGLLAPAVEAVQA